MQVEFYKPIKSTIEQKPEKRIHMPSIKNKASFAADFEECDAEEESKIS